MIQLTRVTKVCGGKTILNDVTLQLARGEVTFIVGSSGAGKTTLLNMIGGLDMPTSGTVACQGEDISKDLNRYRADKVGFIFQDFNLVSGLTVEKNIELALYYGAKSYSESGIAAQIDQLGIKDSKQKAETLSGGEKQRVAIIRSICKNSEIILADEPTGNLDSANAGVVLDLLAGIKKDKYVVIVSHDLEKAEKYADRIITMKDGAVAEDTKKDGQADAGQPTEAHSSNSAGKPAKSRLWKPVFLLGRNSIKRRKTKIFSIALVMALAISALAMVISFNSSGNKISQNVNVNYLENDLINLYYPSSPNAGLMELPFSESETARIRQTYDVKALVPIYEAENDSWIFSVSSKTVPAYLKQINSDDFFKTRVMSNDVEGEFISGKDEIIIAEDVAEDLWGGDCLGKEIALNNGLGESVTCKIVGINHTVNSFDKIYSFISSEKIKELTEMQFENMVFNRIELRENRTEIQAMSTGGAYGTMNPVTGEETIVGGAAPTSKYEVLLSSALLPYALDGLGVPSGSASPLSELMNKELVINCNGLFKVKICGVFQSDEHEFRFAKELIDELKTLDPVRVDIYLNQPGNVPEIKNAIISNEKFTAGTQLESLKSNVSMQTSFFKWALILVGAILLCVSVAMLNSFSKISVLERRKEVAIMKSLGASNKNVLFTLLFDTLAISLLACLLSLAVFAVFTFLLPVVMPEISFISYGYPAPLLLLISLLFAVLVGVSTALGLQKLVRKLPAELFAQ